MKKKRVAAVAILSFTLCGISSAQDRPDVWNHLRNIGAVGGSYLGIGVAEISTDRAKALNLKEEMGVEITRVQEDSPASKAGLKVGDVVLQYNNERVQGTEQFVRLVRETPSGRQARLVISRGGATQTIMVSPTARKGEVFSFSQAFPRELGAVVVPDAPRVMMAWRNSYLGIEAESLTEQLASFFGVKDGVLVRSVNKGTAAEKAGLKAGDVILKVGDRTVDTPTDVTSALRSARQNGRTSIPVVISREKREMTVTVTLDDDETERPQRLMPARTVSGSKI